MQASLKKNEEISRLEIENNCLKQNNSVLMKLRRENIIGSSANDITKDD